MQPSFSFMDEDLFGRYLRDLCFWAIFCELLRLEISRWMIYNVSRIAIALRMLPCLMPMLACCFVEDSSTHCTCLQNSSIFFSLHKIKTFILSSVILDSHPGEGTEEDVDYLDLF